jgi:hypothetical protein
MLKHKEIFDIITAKGLNPNQYYLLASMNDNIQTRHINIALELQALVVKDYVIVTKEDKLILTDKAKKLIKQVESLFVHHAKNAATQKLGDNYEERIKAYNELFPTGKLPTGKYARTNLNNLKNAFKWFFDNFEYDWETIMLATERYVYEFEIQGYKYMRTSQYFIRKQDQDKTYSSDLANYCEIILSGDEESTSHFSVKVV